MAEFLAVKNFERFQHYKDRKPTWIKLYNDLLDDYDFCALPDSSKWLAIGLWLLASRSDNRIRNDPVWIGRMIHATEAVDVRPLIDAGFLSVLADATDVLAGPYQSAIPEQEEESEKERETDPSTTIIPLRATDDLPIDERINLVIRAANRGMKENPAIGAAANPILENHGSRQNVYDWLNQGVPASLAQRVVYDAAKKYRPSPTRKQPHTMAYFSGAVTDAYDMERAEQTQVPNGTGGLPRAGRSGPEAGRGAPAKRDKYAAFVEDGDATGDADEAVRLRTG